MAPIVILMALALGIVVGVTLGHSLGRREALREVQMRLSSILMVNGVADKTITDPQERLNGTLNVIRAWSESLKRKGLK